MIILALLVQMDATLTFGEARRLPPSVVGERLLNGEDHRRIESFVGPIEGQGPPGFVESHLFEQPIATSIACTRRQWTVKFRAAPDGELNSAVPYDRYRATEIALPTSSGCAAADYVHVNPGIPEAEGFATLRQLARLRSGDKKFTITCTDATNSGLCDDRAQIPSALARLKPWNIAADPNGLRMWLGTPGHAVTEVRFSEQQSDHVWITRSIPAPF